MEKPFIKILIGISAALILVGVIIAIIILSSPKNTAVVEVKISDGESEIVAFESLAMLPGVENEYVIRLRSESRDKYDVSLAFSGEISESISDNLFVRVECEALDTPKTLLLAELLSGGTVSFTDTLRPISYYEIKLSYFLHENTGNEAQNAEASFDLTITVNNAGDFYE